MATTKEDQFLHLDGMIHEIDLAPAGTTEDPWPFVMMCSDGHGSTAVQIHREDAEALIAFLSRHLGEEVA